MAVKLRELAEQMDMQMDDWTTYVHVQTGEIISVENRFFAMIEDDVDSSTLIGWEKELLLEAEKITEHWSDWTSLPSQYELRNYDIMEEFAEGYKNPHIGECLSIAIQGRGAFRRFKDTLHRFDIADQWYAHLEDAHLAFARRWCKGNGIAYEE